MEKIDVDLFSKNIDLIHTTVLGEKRIMKNLNLCNIDVIEYLKNKILDSSVIYKKGKNYYCETNNIKITINSNNFCIITAYLISKE